MPFNRGDAKRAETYVETFYDRKELQLDLMNDASSDAVDLFVAMLGEKPIRSGGVSLGGVVFELLISLAPGGIALKKSWRAMAKARPVFADRLMYVISNTNTAIGAVKKAGAKQTKRSTTVTATLEQSLKEIRGRLNRGYSALTRERALSNWYLADIFDNPKGIRRQGDKSWHAHMKAILGPLDQMPTDQKWAEGGEKLKHDCLGELLKTYTRSHVEIITMEQCGARRLPWNGGGDWKKPGKKCTVPSQGKYQRSLSSNVKGLNSGQLDYIYKTFRQINNENDLVRVWGARRTRLVGQMSNPKMIKENYHSTWEPAAQLRLLWDRVNAQPAKAR